MAKIETVVVRFKKTGRVMSVNLADAENEELYTIVRDPEEAFRKQAEEELEAREAPITTEPEGWVPEPLERPQMYNQTYLASLDVERLLKLPEAEQLQEINDKTILVQAILRIRAEQ